MGRGNDTAILFSFVKRSSRGQRKQTDIDRSLEVVSAIAQSGSPREAALALLKEYSPDISTMSRPDYRVDRPAKNYQPWLRGKGEWPEGRGREELSAKEIVSRVNSFSLAYQEMVALTDLLYESGRYFKPEISALQGQGEFYLPFLESLDALLASLERVRGQKNGFLAKRSLDKSTGDLLGKRADLFRVWQSVFSLNVDEKM